MELFNNFDLGTFYSRYESFYNLNKNGEYKGYRKSVRLVCKMFNELCEIVEENVGYIPEIEDDVEVICDKIITLFIDSMGTNKDCHWFIKESQKFIADNYKFEKNIRG